MSEKFVPSFLRSENAEMGGAKDRVPVDFWEFIMHPEDREAIRAMESTRALPWLCKLAQDHALEKFARAELIGDAIRLGPTQLPHIYNLLVDVCKTLRIAPVPEFYLRMMREPNAYTQGEKNPIVTITSGLVEIMSEDDIKVVLAHECGHIIFKHLRYTQVSKLLFYALDSIIGKAAQAASIGVLTGFDQLIYRWLRMSEYSADRVSMLYTGNAADTIRVQLMLAGGLRNLADSINVEEYMRQSADYCQMFKPNNLEGLIANMTLISQDHPYAASRCVELANFAKTSEFKMAAQRLGTFRCPKCGAKMRSLTLCEKGHFC